MSELYALRVNTFQGLQNLPQVAALRQGYFERAGLRVTLSHTNSSAQQLAALAHDEYDLIHTAPDNVINFDTNPAAFGCERATAPHVIMVCGGSNGPLSVYARPNITDAAQLRGRSVGVDNPTSGFAIVLRDLLAAAGLTLDQDYTFVTAGGTGKRATALLDNSVAATILYPPFDLVAAAAGCQRLASSTEAYSAYASQALAATTNWLAAHDEVATRYIAALLAALGWLYAPEARPAVEALLSEEPLLGLAGLPSAQAYEAFTDPRYGFGRHAALDDAGLAQVIALRTRYGQQTAPLGSPADYRDLRWYTRASAARGEDM